MTRHEDFAQVLARIAARRQALGLSQEATTLRVRQLANRGGWPRDPSWLGKIEKGTNGIGLDDAIILAEALQTSVSYLVGETPVAIPGWDEIPESDRTYILTVIEAARKRNPPS